MRRSDFFYDLPAELIAQYPAEPRGASRLLCLDRATGRVRDRRFAELPELLAQGDLLVLNDTRVLPARLYGHKDSGGRVEILVERVLDERRILAQVRASKPPRRASTITLEGGRNLSVVGRNGEFYELITAERESALALMESAGHVPLPPYIHRPDEPLDRERYQTVFARRDGAVAAPTAALHFTEEMLDTLRAKGIDIAFVTLHVGAGTFQPVRTDEVEDHRMHSEWYEVGEDLCRRAEAVKRVGGRIIAVGTTSVRCLESAARGGKLRPARGETDLFIYPGFGFRTVDCVLTNFHLPESSLLMLVCAFAGREHVLQAYRHAVEQRYRFFSYGDAMFVS